METGVEKCLGAVRETFTEVLENEIAEFVLGRRVVACPSGRARPLPQVDVDRKFARPIHLLQQIAAQFTERYALSGSGISQHQEKLRAPVMSNSGQEIDDPPAPALALEDIDLRVQGHEVPMAPVGLTIDPIQVIANF